MSPWSIVLNAAACLGVVATLALGILGTLNSAKKGTGRLGRLEWGMLGAMVLASLFSLCGIVANAMLARRAYQTAARTAETNELGRWYGSLSTRGAYVDMEVSIGINAIRKVDAGYAARLEHSFLHPRHCKARPMWQIGTPFDPIDAYQCQGFTRFGRGVRPTQWVVRFTPNSPLFPEQDRETAAWVLLHELGVELWVSSRSGNKNGGKEVFYPLGSTRPRPFVLFDGTRMYAIVRKDSAPLGRLRIFSVIDLVGRTLTLTTPSGNDCPSLGMLGLKNPQIVKSAACSKVRLLHFALMFPHGSGRDIVFDRKDLDKASTGMAFVARRRRHDGRGVVFRYTLPESPRRLPKHVATDRFGDAWANWLDDASTAAWRPLLRD